MIEQLMIENEQLKLIIEEKQEFYEKEDVDEDEQKEQS